MKWWLPGPGGGAWGGPCSAGVAAVLRDTQALELCCAELHRSPTVLCHPLESWGACSHISYRKNLKEDLSLLWSLRGSHAQSQPSCWVKTPLPGGVGIGRPRSPLEDLSPCPSEQQLILELRAGAAPWQQSKRRALRSPCVSGRPHFQLSLAFGAPTGALKTRGPQVQASEKPALALPLLDCGASCS